MLILEDQEKILNKVYGINKLAYIFLKEHELEVELMFSNIVLDEDESWEYGIERYNIILKDKHFTSDLSSELNWYSNELYALSNSVFYFDNFKSKKYIEC